MQESDQGKLLGLLSTRILKTLKLMMILVFQGACGTCPSATVTMKQGIERVLRENFGSRLGEVSSASLTISVCHNEAGNERVLREILCSLPEKTCASPDSFMCKSHLFALLSI